MKRTAIARRSSLSRGTARLARTAGPQRKTPIKKANRKRRESAFVRCYGSAERVVWIRRLPCLVCDSISPLHGSHSMGSCDNAHTVSGGKGRKADAKTIIPLCRKHHLMYDQHEAPFDRADVRAAMVAAAAVTDDAWQAHLARTGAA